MPIRPRIFLQLDVMDSDAAAADLDAVERHQALERLFAGSLSSNGKSSSNGAVKG
jgi:hypothetical protein